MTDSQVPTVWRNPDEETVGLYPGLVVHDGRVSGSITFGKRRLPVWAIHVDFDEWDQYGSTAGEPSPDHYGVTREAAGTFVHDLLELRGEFGRLLLVLANGERLERESRAAWPKAWWERPQYRKKVAAQLRRCLSALGESQQ